VDLNGRAAVVTGGSSGIGAAVVQRLQQAGSRVAVLDLRADAGDGDLALTCDVAEEDQVVDAVAHAHRALGGLDVAVLAAGIGGMSAVVDMSSSEWDRVQRVNLRGTFLCLREAARAMRQADLGGAIVAVTSVSGFLADRLMAHYCVSKAGVAALVRVAAGELGPARIRVNAVAPGTTDTPLFDAARRLPGYEDQVVGRTPLGGLGSPRAVAEAAVALAGLDWVTGQIVAADGGVSLWSPIDPAERLPR
jgi:NAD(P)-dependent dehydrogenase (short-subunit alcohol dehydrogenase family)